MYSVLGMKLVFMGLRRGVLMGHHNAFWCFRVLCYCSGRDVRMLRRSLGQRYSDAVYV